MFNFLKKKLTGLDLLWDNKLNELLDNGKLIYIDDNEKYFYRISIKHNDYEYNISICKMYKNKNIFLIYRKNLIDGSRLEGFKKTKISRKTYKKFLKKLPELIEEYNLEDYKDVYQ